VRASGRGQAPIHSEIRLGPIPARGAVLRVALCFPDAYPAAMSALGYQTVLERFNSLSGVAAERFVAAASAAEIPRSLESGAPLADFDLVAFSVPYELHYVRIARMLKAGGIPVTRGLRTERDPLVIAGGPAITMNPAPLEAFIDGFVIGEGEETAAEIGIALLGSRPEDRLSRLARIEGVYVPGLSELPVPARHVTDLDAYDPTSHILSPHAEFAHTLLVEVMRGCGRACRFCLARMIYAPQRFREPARVLERIDARLSALPGPHPKGLTVGLIGPAVSDHPGLAVILSGLVDRGLRVSTSSLRLDSLTDDVARLLHRGGQRTITLAPECGSERLRRHIGKPCADQTIQQACKIAVEAGFGQAKLYFMVGLPTETDEDAGAVAELVREIQGTAGFRRCSISIAPFVPKPQTPFERESMAPIDVLEARIRVLEAECRRIAGVAVRSESVSEAALQCVLARGGTELSPVILRAADSGRSLWSTLRRSLDTTPYLTGAIPHPTPWACVSRPSRP
jgi:radical SAM superfamily enzyme YgiQ (UPF0313 family)